MLDDAGRRADAAMVEPRQPVTVALLFLTPSLRTRFGFAAATLALGGTPVDVPGLRWDPSMSHSESFADTLRCLTGMADAVVVRAPFPLREMVAPDLPGAVINGGDTFEHPTQALIDLFAIERFKGSVADQRIAVCGDLTMRAARSFLALLERLPPRELVLVAAPGRGPGELGPALAGRTREAAPGDLSGVDVLSMIGLPEGEGAARLTAAERAPFTLTAPVAGTLPADAIVLSPLPLVDEIDATVRRDARLRVFEQSDLGVAVRAAVLHRMVRRHDRLA